MRYPPEQVDRLAAEYVIGTLHGSSRRRFETLMQRRSDIQRAVWDWERALNGLAAVIEPENPPAWVWAGVRRRIAQKRTARASLRFWRTAFGVPLVAAAAAWIAIALWPVPSIDRVAVFADAGAQALWSVSADVDERRLIAQTYSPPASGANSVYELWLLPAGQDPVSLGIIPEAAGVVESGLTRVQLDAFRLSANVAISIEPSGGSPTGLPTGPVVYQAALVSL